MKRKLVRSGNSSFTVALPIEWVRQNGLDKTFLVDVSENDMGELLLSPPKDGEEIIENKTYKISLNEKNSAEIFYKVLNAYLEDYNHIEFEGENVKKFKPLVEAEIKKFIGLEFLEIRPNKLLVKNFSFNEKNMKPQEIIQRMNFGISDAFELLNSYFSEGFSNKNVAEVKEIKEQNRKMFFLARKIILKYQKNRYSMNKEGLSYSILSKEKSIITNLNHLSVMLSLLSDYFFKAEGIQKDEKKEISKIFLELWKNYKKIIQVISTQNYIELIDIRKNSSIKRIKKVLSFQKFSPEAVRMLMHLIICDDTIGHLALEISEGYDGSEDYIKIDIKK